MKEKKADFIIAGLGFGDEGKGAITDYLVHKYKIVNVTRYNGGSQAAHTVITPAGVTHTFSQFGSGTFLKGTKTYLSSQMLIDPYSLLEEDLVLKQKGISDVMNRLTLDPSCIIITPFHKMLGRMAEVTRGKKRFGSTGKGVGQAIWDIKNNPQNLICLRDFFFKKNLREKLEHHCLTKLGYAKEILSEKYSTEAERIYHYFKDKYNTNNLFYFYTGFANSYSKCIDRKGKYFPALLKSKSSLLFEGAQGALLDPEFGFLPFITKTNTTFSHAEKLIPHDSHRRPIRVGVMRAYSHRHGMGPLPTESKSLSKKIQEAHNLENPWQGVFRIGWLDLVLCRYGNKINESIDLIALTCLDQLSGFTKIKVCISYEYKGKIADDRKRFFQFEQIGENVKITGINRKSKSSDIDRMKLTDVLLKCKPLEYLEFKGWKENLALVQSTGDIPMNLKVFLDFLESKEGLNTPISILSFGKTRTQKIIYRELATVTKSRLNQF